MGTQYGGCLWGAMRFRLTGAPSVAWLTVPLRNFEILRGAPRSFVSSPGIVRTFCPTCGSPITYATAESPDTIDLATALLDDAMAFPPDREIWLDHRLAWEPIDPTRTQCR